MHPRKIFNIKNLLVRKMCASSSLTRTISQSPELDSKTKHDGNITSIRKEMKQRTLVTLVTLGYGKTFPLKKLDTSSPPMTFSRHLPLEFFNIHFGSKTWVGRGQMFKTSFKYPSNTKGVGMPDSRGCTSLTVAFTKFVPEINLGRPKRRMEIECLSPPPRASFIQY